MRSPEDVGVSGSFLLGLARESIEYGFDNKAPLPVHLDDLPASLAEPAATFTTLRLEGALRGCCGRLEAAEPLRRDEFEAVSIEVSVLTAMEPMQVNDEADLLEQLQPAVDGLVIAEGWRRATFLPKVWENLPEPRQFLGQLKLKCGLPEDYWSSRLEFRRYRTVIYAEPD